MELVEETEPDAVFPREAEDVVCDTTVELDCEASKLPRVIVVGDGTAVCGLAPSNANSPSADMGDGVRA